MLGYPTHSLSTLQHPLGYPSALLKCCRATMKHNCARVLAARGRLITFALGAGFQSRQVHTEVRYLVMRNFVLGGRLGLFLGLRCLFENGNSKKILSVFFVKTQFLQTKLGICNLP